MNENVKYHKGIKHLKKMRHLKGALILMLLFVSGLLSLKCSAFSDYRNFENETVGLVPSGYNLFPKALETGGKILIAGDSANKYINMKITYPSGATAKDSYMDTRQMSSDKKLRLSIRVNPQNLQNGEFAVVLRDSAPKFISLVKFSGSKFIALPDFNKNTYDRTIIPTGWYNVIIDVDFENQIFEVMLDGIVVASEPFNSTHKAFNPANYTIRYNHVISSTVVGAISEVNIDDLIVDDSFMNDADLFIKNSELYCRFNEVLCQSDGFSRTNTVYKGGIINLSTGVRAVNAYICSYSGNKLTDVLVFSDDIAAGGVFDMSGDVTIKGDTDKVKVMYFDNNLRPLAHSVDFFERNYDIPYSEEILFLLKENNPNKSHPRILADQTRFDLINSMASKNSDVSSWKANMLREADTILTQTPIPYTKTDGLRLSANNTTRLISLSFAYKLTNDPKYANKVIEYINVTAAYPDWNSANHFLDTSGLAVGFAVAYDWCYDYFSQSGNSYIKSVIKETLRDYALIPAMNAYNSSAWWTAGTNNWCVVCNGGMLMAALAIGDEDGFSELCGNVAANAIKSMRNALPLFAPDGAWFEGPGYWGYTVEYLANYVSTLNTALKTDFGTMDFPGVSQTGYFPIYMTGATNRTFNLHDADEATINVPEIGWLGNITNDINLSKYRYYQLKKLNYGCRVKDLLWLDFSVLSQPLVVDLPTERMFRDSEAASLRNNFFGTASVFAALHGGENNIPHGSLDVGVFTYEALGERWAIDLGGDNYNLYNFFDNSNYRWWYYRNRAEGHNVIVMNPAENILCDQDLDAFSPITELLAGNNASYTVANTESAYKKYTNAAIRGLYLDKLTGGIMLQDEIQFKNGISTDLYWFMHTKATTITLSIDKKSAILTQNGKRIWVGIISGGNEELEIRDALPFDTSPNPDTLPENINNLPPNPTQQNKNVGIRKLTINNPAASGNYTLSVAMLPLNDGQTIPTIIPTIMPIANWEATLQ